MSRRGSNKKYNVWIWVLSILIPIVVASLFRVRIPNVESMDFLPPIYATFNGVTAILLVIAVYQIKRGNQAVHELLMKSSIVLSVLFLILYMMYHMTSDSTSYGGEGVLRYVYFFVLITHIILSIIVIPFVLITYVRAISSDFERHKRIARITFPLWLYVAISGVVVYLMIAPYY